MIRLNPNGSLNHSWMWFTATTSLKYYQWAWRVHVTIPNMESATLIVILIAPAYYLGQQESVWGTPVYLADGRDIELPACYFECLYMERLLFKSSRPEPLKLSSQTPKFCTGNQLPNTKPTVGENRYFLDTEWYYCIGLRCWEPQELYQYKKKKLLRTTEIIQALLKGQLPSVEKVLKL